MNGTYVNSQKGSKINGSSRELSEPQKRGENPSFLLAFASHIRQQSVASTYKSPYKSILDVVQLFNIVLNEDIKSRRPISVVEHRARGGAEAPCSYRG